MPTDDAAPKFPKMQDARRFERHAVLVRRLNLADFQNSVPALPELAVANGTQVALQALHLSVSSRPALVNPQTWLLDAAGAAQTMQIKELDLQRDGALLSDLTASEKANVVFKH